MRKYESKDKSWWLVHIRCFFQDREAISALEYAVLVAIIATAIVATLVSFSGNIAQAIRDIAPEITEATGEVGD